MNDRFKFRVRWEKEHRYRVDAKIHPIEKFFRKEFVIEQCTGLKDKNGNLIYEGDLIKSPNNSHKLAIIRMENGVYGCKERRFNGVWEMNLYDLIKHYGVEIIGNIHEQAKQKDVK